MRKEFRAISVLVFLGILAVTMLGLTQKKSSSISPDSCRGHGHENGQGHDHCDDCGPHDGKVVRDGDLELEVAVHGRNCPAHLRIYPSFKNQPVDPKDISVSVELERLGGKVDTIEFKPASGFLFSDKEVGEPFSFFVKVTARYRGESYEWEYSQYEGRLHIPNDLTKTMGIETDVAGPGSTVSTLELPGEITFNADTISHVVPRVPGVVLEVRKTLGDKVSRGEIVAVIDSRELGDARSRYLVALEREGLARYNFERAQRLWESNTIAEKEFLTAQKKFLEEKIELTTAARKLTALGLSEDHLTGLAGGDHKNLTMYVIRSPLDGTVIKKHVSVGEWLKEDAELFIIADLSTVWVEVTVYAKDLDAVHIGQEAVVKADGSELFAVGNVSYIGPLVGENSRTAKARVVLPNPEGKWRPGLFVGVEVVRFSSSSPVVARNEAVQYVGTKPVVFVRVEDQYEMRPVVLGKSDKKCTEILQGIEAGDSYVTKNSYVLKAELGKTGMSHQH